MDPTEFVELCKRLFCPRNLIILAAVAIMIFGLLSMQTNPSITQLSHVYIHNPGECHIDQECSLGKFCFHECLQFNENGICTNSPEIGKCTNFCTMDSDCTNSTCQTKAWWHFNVGSVVKVCA